MDKELRKRIRGALIGIAYGDSFGMPVEMWSREKIAAEYGRIREHLPGNEGNLISKGFKAFEVTDDTIHSTLVIDMLNSSKGQVNPETFMALLKSWADASPKSNLVLGPSTAKAMEKLASGVPMEKTGLTGTTNGAAMKILPIGLLHETEQLDELVEDVRLLCLPTHNTSSAISGACAAAAAACYALSVGNAENTGEFQVRVLDEMLHIAQKAAKKGRLCGNQIGGPSVSARLEFTRQYIQSHTEEESIEFIADIIGTGLPIEESVTAALAFVYLAKGSPKLCAEYAVSAGGDTDTIGAIACGICGALCGENGFDAKTVKQIEIVNDLSFDELAGKMMTARKARETEWQVSLAEGGGYLPKQM